MGELGGGIVAAYIHVYVYVYIDGYAGTLLHIIIMYMYNKVEGLLFSNNVIYHLHNIMYVHTLLLFSSSSPSRSHYHRATTCVCMYVKGIFKCDCYGEQFRIASISLSYGTCAAAGK